MSPNQQMHFFIMLGKEQNFYNTKLQEASQTFLGLRGVGVATGQIPL